MSRHGQDFIDVGFTGLTPWEPVTGHVELSRTHNVEEAEVQTATRIIEDPLTADLMAEAEQAAENYGLELTMQRYGPSLTPAQKVELANQSEPTGPATLAEADEAARGAVERREWGEAADKRGELL